MGLPHLYAVLQLVLSVPSVALDRFLSCPAHYLPPHDPVASSAPFADSRLPVYERLHKHGQALAAKLEQKRSEHAEKEVEGATFKPEARVSRVFTLLFALCVSRR